jgi:hypothetical protein
MYCACHAQGDRGAKSFAFAAIAGSSCRLSGAIDGIAARGKRVLAR